MGTLVLAVNQQNGENPLLSSSGLTLTDQQALAVCTNRDLHNARIKSLTHLNQTTAASHSSPVSPNGV